MAPDSQTANVFFKNNSLGAHGWPAIFVAAVSFQFGTTINGGGPECRLTGLLPALHLDVYLISQVVGIRNWDGECEIAVGRHAHRKGDRDRAGVGLRARRSAVALQGLKPRSVGLGENAFLGRAIFIPWTEAVTQLLGAYVVSPGEIGAEGIFRVGERRAGDRVVNRDPVTAVDGYCTASRERTEWGRDTIWSSTRTTNTYTAPR